MDKRVLFMSYLGGIGGGERFLLNHMLGLRSRGFYPVLLVCSEGELFNRCQKLGIQVELLPITHYSRFGRYVRSLRIIKFLISLLRKERISLVHLNDMELGKFGAIAAKMLGISVVWTCHGWWYSGAFREFFYNQFVDHVVTVSAAVQASLCKRKLLSNKKTIVIHPGIDTKVFSPLERDESLASSLGLSSDNVVVAILGRFQPIKGHLRFLVAAREVARRMPNVIFLVVGGNVFQSKEDAEHQLLIQEMICDDVLLKNAVKLVPFHENIPLLFSVVDILVSASDAESFGMVHLEAMACSRPIISTNVGGPSEIVIDGITGWLVSPLDTMALADKLTQLCQDKNTRLSFGMAGRRRVVDFFNIERQVDKYCSMVYSAY